MFVITVYHSRQCMCVSLNWKSSPKGEIMMILGMDVESSNSNLLSAFELSSVFCGQVIFLLHISGISSNRRPLFSSSSLSLPPLLLLLFCPSYSFFSTSFLLFFYSFSFKTPCMHVIYKQALRCVIVNEKNHLQEWL